jgi:hypothetical protein
MVQCLLKKLTVIRLVTTFLSCSIIISIHENLSLELLLMKFNPFQALTFYPYKIQFNTIPTPILQTSV